MLYLILFVVLLSALITCFTFWVKDYDGFDVMTFSAGLLFFLLNLTLVTMVSYTESELNRMRTEALACKYYVENNELTKENVAIYNQSLDKVVEYNRRIEEGKSGYSSYWFCVWYDSDVEKFDVITIDK